MTNGTDYNQLELLQIIKELADDVRSMDQLIFHMSQCSSWQQMRPFFNKLQIMQEIRQKAESNRINDILRAELLQIYTKQGLTRIEGPS
jgi:hypothetical protein